VVVAHRVLADDLADLAARQEGVVRGLRQLGAQGELGGAGFDGRVALAVQGGGEVAAQGGVDGAGLGGGEQLVAARGRVLTGHGGLGDGEFAVAPDRGQRPVGPEAETGDAGAYLLPQLPCAQGGFEFRTARAATHPDLAEVAQRSTASLRLALDLYDLMAAFHCLPGVHGSHHAASDDCHSHDGHAPPDPGTGKVRLPTKA
jgi:hypothetical protein